MRSLLSGFCLACIACARPPSTAPGSPEAAPRPPDSTELVAPATARREVVHDYHGTPVVDPYEWLEGSDEPVRAWGRAQNAHARRVLDTLPGRAALTARLRELITESPDWYEPRHEGGRLFALEDRPPKQQPYLVSLAGPDPASARVVLDPNELDPSGGTSVDWYAPSDDARLVAVSLSSGGSESGIVHVYDTATGQEHAGDRVPFAHGGTAGGSLAWAKDGSGFWYTRYPHPGERPARDLAFYQQVYFHRLGSSSETDSPSLVDGLPRIAEISLERSDDGRWLLADVADGDGGDFIHFVLDTRATPRAWRPLAVGTDRVTMARFAGDGSLWLLSRKDAGKGALLRIGAEELSAADALARARRVLPEGDRTIRAIEPTASRVYVLDSLGGPSGVRIIEADPRRFDAAGVAPTLGHLPLSPNAGVSALARLGADDVIYRAASYVDAPAWYHFHGAQGRSERTGLAQLSRINWDDVEVLRETCTSKDGTAVPLQIVRPKGTRLDGDNPTLLYGYGGFGTAIAPAYSAAMRAFFDRGGVYAVANLRGGGEFGEDWHRAGKLIHKQNVFDDFIACARHLIDARYTRPERLAIRGRSNGGLLVGAALTQAPDLFRAAVAEVGVYDVLRFELSDNGQFNVPELGSVRDEAQFRALLAYSPYHNVRDGQRYPATLLMTGENDPRVPSFQSRKMAARLQAASPASSILLRTSGNTGHGAGTPLDAEIEQAVDAWGFLFWQLGM